MTAKWSMQSRAILASVLLTGVTGGTATAVADETLIEGARKEGKLVWYTTMISEDFQPLINTFMKKYPFLRAEAWRGGREVVLNRIQSEARAGQFLFDVVSISSSEAGILKASGLTQRYQPPSAVAYPKSFVDPEGYWVAAYVNYYVIGYNTKLVSKTEAPKDWQDLLLPQWKGKLAMEVENYAWFRGLKEAWGQEKAVQFARSLTTQDIRWRKGLTLTARLLAAGESHAAIVAANSIETLKARGAPVEWVTTTDPIPAEVHPIQVAARALHPNAAKLFVEFVASREGQTLIKNLQRIPAHPDVAPGWSVNPKELKLQGVGVAAPDRVSQLVKEWREIFNPTGS